MKQSLKLLLLFAFVFISGCFPESDNDLPAKSLHDDARVVGEFYTTEEDGRRNDVRIAKMGNKKGHYIASSPDGKEETRFRLYKIGDAEFISYGLRKDEKGMEIGGYTFHRLTVSRTQLVVESLNDRWLIANPDALPGTEFEHGPEKFKKTRIKASSEKLEQFLQFHSDSKTVFDVKNPILLNRAGT